MVLPEQDQPTRDVYETYPGSEINGQLHGIALRTVGSFEHSQPQSFGTEVIEFTNFPPLNVVQLQEQDLVDRYVLRLLSYSLFVDRVLVLSKITTLVHIIVAFNQPAL